MGVKARLLMAAATVIVTFGFGSTADAFQYECTYKQNSNHGYVRCLKGTGEQRAHMLCYDTIRQANFVAHGPWVVRGEYSWVICNRSMPTVGLTKDNR